MGPFLEYFLRYRNLGGTQFSCTLLGEFCELIIFSARPGSEN